MQSSFAPVRALFSPFDGSRILLLFAQKTFGFYKLFNAKSVANNVGLVADLKRVLSLILNILCN